MVSVVTVRAGAATAKSVWSFRVVRRRVGS
jgi:hypothetical protein